MNSFFFFLSELIVNRILIVSIVVNKISSSSLFFKKKKLKIYVSSICIYIFSRATLNETFTAKYDGVLHRTP